MGKIVILSEKIKHKVKVVEHEGKLVYNFFFEDKKTGELQKVEYNIKLQNADEYLSIDLDRDVIDLSKNKIMSVLKNLDDYILIKIQVNEVVVWEL